MPRGLPLISMKRLKKRMGFRVKKWARSFRPTLNGFRSSSLRCVCTDRRKSFSISLQSLSSKCWQRQTEKEEQRSEPWDPDWPLQHFWLCLYSFTAFFGLQPPWRPPWFQYHSSPAVDRMNPCALNASLLVHCLWGHWTCTTKPNKTEKNDQKLYRNNKN